MTANVDAATIGRSDSCTYVRHVKICVNDIFALCAVFILAVKAFACKCYRNIEVCIHDTLSSCAIMLRADVITGKL